MSKITPSKKSNRSIEKNSIHIMSHEEMAKQEMIKGVGKMPSKYDKYLERGVSGYIHSKTEPKVSIVKEQVDKRKNLWKIDLQSGNRILREMPVLQQDQIDVRELKITERYPATKSFRPRWADLEYWPKIIPHKNPFRGLLTGIKAGIGIRGGGGMQFLDYDINEALTMSYPWRCIGKIFTGDDNGPGSSGTGVLVGPNLMMTASHMWRWGAPGRWMRFSPGFREGDQHPDSFVTRIRGIKNDEDPTGYDYIICQLQKPLGEMLGWMGSMSFGNEDNYYNGRWISVGYPGVFYEGKRPRVDFGIEIEDIDNDDPGLELEVDYSTAFGGGWSGGPLWGTINNDFKIIGIRSGFEWDGWDPVRGVFSGGNLMVELIKHGLANFK